MIIRVAREFSLASQCVHDKQPSFDLYGKAKHHARLRPGLAPGVHQKSRHDRRRRGHASLLETSVCGQTQASSTGRVIGVNDRIFDGYIGIGGKLSNSSDIRLGINLTLEGDVSLLLISLVNPKADSKAGLERNLRADRFRPLQEQREKQTATNAVEEKKGLTQPVEAVWGVSTFDLSPPAFQQS
jgi:hypothetical protein